MTGLPPRLAGLLHQAAYPHRVWDLRLVQTPISWVFLTGEWAYKVKRPVRLPFADFRDLGHRAFLCREELRLNRRFAPEIYDDVCVITGREGVARIGGEGEVIEYAVRMRQFAGDDELDRLLAAGAIGPAVMRDFGAGLARIHDALPVAAASQPWGDPASIRQVVLANLDELGHVAAEFADAAGLGMLRASILERLAALQPFMATRKTNGRVRECHGDLHMRNVVRRGSALVPFDCLEFEPSFRWIDVADEVAFLHMDVSSEGHAVHAHAFLDGYAAAGGDYAACRLLRLYSAHRALVRAKVAAFGLREARGDEHSTLRARLRNYMAAARDSLQERQPALVLMRGYSGSGKTWLAAQLAPKLGALHVRSDVERKRLAGLPELARTGSAPGAGIYSAERDAGVHQRLAECAAHVLAGGYTAIVDATFLRQRDRDALRAAAPVGGQPILIDCHAPRPVLQRRLAERMRTGHDASEADATVLAYQEESGQPVGPDEGLTVIHADTTRQDIVGEVLRALTT